MVSKTTHVVTEGQDVVVTLYDGRGLRFQTERGGECMFAEVQDYYEMLGVAPTASAQEIRRAFRSLARQFHPDLALDKRTAEEKFKGINEAYEVLSDADARRRYDRGEGLGRRFSCFGSRHIRKPNRNFRGDGASENFRPYTERPEFRSFYEQYTKGARDQTQERTPPNGGSSRHDASDNGHSRTESKPGRNIEGEIQVALEEVLHGSVRTVSVLRHSPLAGEAERRFLHVRIPPGVLEGQTLRLEGKGDYGKAGGASGDLLLRVNVQVHPDFWVRDADLYCELELTAWESFVGGKKTIPTLEGPVRVKVPPATLHGHRLRLRGKGLPKANGTRGDLYAVVTVKSHLANIVNRVWRRG